MILWRAKLITHKAVGWTACEVSIGRRMQFQGRRPAARPVQQQTKFEFDLRRSRYPPVRVETQPCMRCAKSISDAVRPLGVEVRSGVHTGEIEMKGDDVAGLAVHIAARVAAAASAGQVLVSSTVRDLVAGSGLTFQDQGLRALKGIDEPLRLLSLSAV